MLKLQKSSLILILIIVSLIAGCVSIYTLGYTPGTVWHKAEDVKPGTFGQNVGSGNYNFNFPGNVGIKNTNPTLELDVTGNIYATDQVIAGTKVKVGASEITSGKITGLDAPTNPSDAATKAYVDEQIAQIEASGGVFTIVEGTTCPDGQIVASRYYPETKCGYASFYCTSPGCVRMIEFGDIIVGPGWSINPKKSVYVYNSLKCEKSGSGCNYVDVQASWATCTAPNTHVLCTDPESLPTPTL